MKKIIVIIVLALAPVLIYAQPVPPPSQNGQNGNQPGGGAPLDGGLSILLLMGAAYGTKKVYNFKRKSKTI
jgi:hypothetical protein